MSRENLKLYTAFYYCNACLVLINKLRSPVFSIDKRVKVHLNSFLAKNFEQFKNNIFKFDRLEVTQK